MRKFRRNAEVDNGTIPLDTARIATAARGIVRLTEHQFPGQDPELPYDFFEPKVTMGGKILSRPELIQEVNKFANVLSHFKVEDHGARDGGVISITFDLADGASFADVFVDVVSDHIRAYLGGHDKAQSYDVVEDVIAQIMRHASVGGSYAKAGVIIRSGESKVDPSREWPHLDGTVDDTGSGGVPLDISTVRYVYSTGPGTILFPEARPSNYQPIVSLPGQVIHSMGAHLTESELMESDSQQVLPGIAMGFDNVRGLWHQAPRRALDDVTLMVSLWRLTKGDQIDKA